MRFAPCECGLQKMAFVSLFLWAWLPISLWPVLQGPSQTSPTFFSQGMLTSAVILPQLCRIGWPVPLWRRNDLIEACLRSQCFQPWQEVLGRRGVCVIACRVQREPNASGPWAGTAPLTAVMLPSQDLAAVFCSLTLSPPTYRGLTTLSLVLERTE